MAQNVKNRKKIDVTINLSICVRDSDPLGTRLA